MCRSLLCQSSPWPPVRKPNVSRIKFTLIELMLSVNCENTHIMRTPVDCDQSMESHCVLDYHVWRWTGCLCLQGGLCCPCTIAPSGIVLCLSALTFKSVFKISNAVYLETNADDKAVFDVSSWYCSKDGTEFCPEHTTIGLPFAPSEYGELKVCRRTPLVVHSHNL